MNLFFKKSSANVREPLDVKALEVRLEALERGVAGLRLEWKDTQLVLERILGRVTGALKRSRSDEPEEEQPPPPPPEPERPINPLAAALLSRGGNR